MLNRKKYIVSLLAIVFLTIFGFTFVNATSEIDETKNVEENIQSENFEGFFDTDFSNEVYKFSEKDRKISLPFFRFSNERMIIDQELTKSGFCFSAKSIEIDSNLKGIQTLFSADSIRVNSNIEYGILFADGDIIVDSDITKSVILISSGTVTINENVNINEDVICLCNKLELKGNILGSVIASVENVNITGKIKGDLRVSTNNISFGNNENVDGNIYVSTYNKDLNLSEKYPNAIIKLQEVKVKNEFSFNIVFEMLLNCLVFALMYIIINKIAKKDIFNSAVEKISKNAVIVLLSGTVLLIAFMPIIFLLIMLSVIGLWAIAVPILLIYIVFIVIMLLLNVFIVGSLMYKYIKQKYIKTGGFGTDLLGAFCSYLILNVLTKIPFVGGYVSIILYILAIGIVFTLIFKRKDEK